MGTQPPHTIIPDARIPILHSSLQQRCPPRTVRYRRQRSNRIRAHPRHRVRFRELFGDVLAVARQMHRAAEQHFAARQGRAFGDRAVVEVDDILVAPGDMLALVHDVEADRQAFGRELAVDVAVGSVEHHLALIELAALDEFQVQGFAEAAVDRLGIVIIIVADIAGAEIAGGEEAEIMVVRDAVGEGRGAARGEGGVALGRPHIRAEVKAARAAVEKEDLRRIAVHFELVGVARLERGDDAVGEEIGVALEAGQEVGAVGDARLIGEVDAAFVEAGGDFGEVECGAGGRVDQAGHAFLLSPPAGGRSWGRVSDSTHRPPCCD